MSQYKSIKYKLQNTPVHITETYTKLTKLERERSDFKSVYELYILSWYSCLWRGGCTRCMSVNLRVFLMVSKSWGDRVLSGYTERRWWRQEEGRVILSKNLKEMSFLRDVRVVRFSKDRMKMYGVPGVDFKIMRKALTNVKKHIASAGAYRRRRLKNNNGHSTEPCRTLSAVLPEFLYTLPFSISVFISASNHATV